MGSPMLLQHVVTPRKVPPTQRPVLDRTPRLSPPLPLLALAAASGGVIIAQEILYEHLEAVSSWKLHGK